MSNTNLILDIACMPPESTSNCIQELKPIPNGAFTRNINGDLLFIKHSDRKRYSSFISGKDVNSAIVDSIWVGSQINIGCIQNLWQEIKPGDTSTTLIRPPVSNSILAVNNFGEPIPFSLADNNVTINKIYEEKIFICFRPWLTMKVLNFSIESDEWGMSCGWKLYSEEI